MVAGLRLRLLTVDRLEISDWLSLDQSSGKLVGMPLDTHIGHETYVLEATDTRGRKARADVVRISFYASTNVVTGGIMFSECSCIRACIGACMSPEQTLLARYLPYLLTEFDQTFITNGLWGKDERFKFWGQNVKGQGHGGVKYAPKCTFWPC